MAVKKSERAGDSGAEERFAQLFCEAFGEEKGQFVYLQHPFVDIYGNHRTIDFAVMTEDGKVAFEIDGETWHNPSKVSQDKYADDLLKQNSMVFQGWRVFRWTDTQLTKAPDRVKDELITFLGYAPVLTYFDGDTPAQQGSVFELREHQEEALANLVKMREEGKTIALVQGATGSGKSAIGVLDAKQVGKRVLFLAHTKELVEQGAENFERLWPEVSVGRFYESLHDTASFVICGSIQSIIRNLDQFKPDDFDYLIIDECHHASAKSYTKILTYFRPKFTLGLTATPERADGADLLEVFQTVAHKLDIKDAVETGVLCPVRCIRVKTNIDMLFGFQFISLGMYLYMSAEQGCGPKDGLMIVIGKKLPKIPIGIIGILLWSAVTLIGWMLGGSVGIGTLLSIFGAGFIMHIFYDAIGFEPRKLKHKSLKDTLKSLSGKCF
ncbi:MAG TPA: DEAD/DEAH box helicase family protein [Ruminococcus flavefaciens]|nr:DEAD/DEAH box helicase family protein [Ruminococcus flavefaciens]